MNIRTGKRQLVLEPPAQRVLLAAKVLNPAQETTVPADPSAGNLADIVDYSHTTLVGGEGQDLLTRDPCDVNGDGYLTPRDALLIANGLNARGFRQLGAEGEPGNIRLDVNGDAWVSPVDLLGVINALNRQAELRAIPQCYPVPSEPSPQIALSPNVRLLGGDHVDQVLLDDPDSLTGDDANTAPSVAPSQFRIHDSPSGTFVPFLSGSAPLVEATLDPHVVNLMAEQKHTRCSIRLGHKRRRDHGRRWTQSTIFDWTSERTTHSRGEKPL